MDKIKIIKDYINALEPIQSIGYIDNISHKSLHFKDKNFLELAKEFGKEKELKIKNTSSYKYPYEAYFLLDDIKIYAIFSEEELINAIGEFEILKEEIA